MTNEEREYVDQLKDKIAKYEDFITEAIEGPFKVGVIGAGPDNGLYLVKEGSGNTILPLSPKIKGTLKVGTTVMINNRAIVDIVSDDLIEKESEIEFDYIDWNEIGGIKSQMEKIKDAVENPFKYKKYYEYFGLKPSKGVLLHGAPGCGKTLIAKAIASYVLRDQELTKDSFVYLKGGEMLSPYVGVTENRIKSVFENARANFKKTGNRSVIFIDEAEAILPSRGSRKSSDVETTIVPTFLSEMDGFEDSGAFVILATNHASHIDSAVIRPGRIDLHVEITRPNKSDAEEIFMIHLKKTKCHGNVKKIAEEAANILFDSKHVHNVSGAMIANIVQNSISNAIKRLINSGKTDSRKGVVVDDILLTIQSL